MPALADVMHGLAKDLLKVETARERAGTDPIILLECEQLEGRLRELHTLLHSYQVHVLPRIAQLPTGMAKDPWGTELPILELTGEEMRRLLEYSASIPTGKTIGKRWKRRLDQQGSIWSIGEYAELSPEDQLKWPGEIAILWSAPVVDGGKPYRWKAPR